MRRILRTIRYFWPALRMRLKGSKVIGSGKHLLLQPQMLALAAMQTRTAEDTKFLHVDRLDANAETMLEEMGTVTMTLQTDVVLADFAKTLIGSVRPFINASETSAQPSSPFSVVFGSQSMTALIGDGTPIANVRQGVDQGMVDFYNIDNFFAEAKKIRESMLKSGVQQILERVSGNKLKLKSMNAYINIGVTDTRGFHVDAYGVKQYKAFVYLTDVKRVQDGPYCYIPSSARDSSMEELNRFLAWKLGADPTDILLGDFRSALPFLAPSGTVIISDQGGAHRGHPQSSAGERAICVFNFFESD